MDQSFYLYKNINANGKLINSHYDLQRATSKTLSESLLRQVRILLLLT